MGHSPKENPKRN